MDNIQTVTYKLVSGDTLDVTTLEANDPNWTYSLHVVTTLGGITDVIGFTLNGIFMEFAGGTEINKIPVRTLSVDNAYSEFSINPGLFVIGSKTTKELFGNKNF